MGSYAIGIDINGKEHRIDFKDFNQLTFYALNLKSVFLYDKLGIIKYFDCRCNMLEKITIIGGHNIVYINIVYNNLTYLDLSMCNNLIDLYCDIELDGNIKLPYNIEKINYFYFSL